MIPLVISGFLILAYRNNMLYVMISALAIVTIFSLRYVAMRAIGLGIGIALVAFALWTSVGYSILGVQRSNSAREMVSIPAATISYLAYKDALPSLPSTLGGVDIDAMANGWQSGSQNSDNFRVYLWPAIDNGKMDDLLRYWLDCVIEHPNATLTSALVLTRSAWDFTVEPNPYRNSAVYEYDNTDSSYFACWVEDPGSAHSLFPALQKLFWDISRVSYYGGQALLGLLGSPAVFVWTTLACFLYSLSRRRWTFFVVTFILVLTILTLLLGPTVLPRYYWFLYLFSPVCLVALLKAPSFSYVHADH